MRGVPQAQIFESFCSGQAHIAQEYETSRRFLTQGNQRAYNLREVELSNVSVTTTDFREFS